MSAKSEILNFLDGKDWVPAGRIEAMGDTWGYKCSNLSRRCRELYQSGLIERKIERGFVWYRELSNKMPQFGEKSSKCDIIPKTQKNLSNTKIERKEGLQKSLFPPRYIPV